MDWLAGLPNLVRVTLERALLTDPKEIEQVVPERVEVVRTR